MRRLRRILLKIGRMSYSGGIAFHLPLGYKLLKHFDYTVVNQPEVRRLLFLFMHLPVVMAVLALRCVRAFFTC